MWSRYLAIIVITSILIAVLWWTELTYGPIQPNADNYNQYHPSHKQSPGDDLVHIIGVVLWTIINTIESHHDVWLVLGTFALAAFTFTLWRSTNRLWRTSQKHADHMERSVRVAERAADAAKSSAGAAERTVETMEKTAQRQLRAYLNIWDATIIYTNAEWSPNVRIQFKNAGLTPGYKVENRCEYYFAMIGEPEFEMLEQTTSYSDLGPGQDRTTTMIIPLAQWERNKPLVGSKICTFYAFGEITYFDAFGAEHFTKYRLQMAVDEDGVTDGGLIFSDEGNESN